MSWEEKRHDFEAATRDRERSCERITDTGIGNDQKMY